MLFGAYSMGAPADTAKCCRPPVTISSLIGVFLASLDSPNLAWDEYSHRVGFAEVEVVSMMAQLLGYDPERAGGMLTFGGTGTKLYGMKFGLKKSLPGSMEHGIREDPVMLSSDSSHYCRYNIAGWLGLGSHNLITIPTTIHNEIDLKVLREEGVQSLQAGRKIVGMIATLGTTDTFGLDDLQGMVRFRNELVQEFSLPYCPHIHADASLDGHGPSLPTITLK